MSPRATNHHTQPVKYPLPEIGKPVSAEILPESYIAYLTTKEID